MDSSTPSTSATLERVKEKLRKEVMVEPKREYKKSLSLKKKLERRNRQLVYFSPTKDREDRLRKQERIEAEMKEKKRKEEEIRRQQERKREHERRRKEEKKEEERKARRENEKRVKKEEEQKRQEMIKKRNKETRENKIIDDVLKAMIEKVVEEEKLKEISKDTEIEVIMNQMKLPELESPIRTKFIKLQQLKIGHLYQVVGGGTDNSYQIKLKEGELRQINLPKSKDPPPKIDNLFLMRTKGEERNIKWINE